MTGDPHSKRRLDRFSLVPFLVRARGCPPGAEGGRRGVAVESGERAATRSQTVRRRGWVCVTRGMGGGGAGRPRARRGYFRCARTAAGAPFFFSLLAAGGCPLCGLAH
jgi:hypothetical protein